MPITPKQKKILDFILDFRVQNGFSPSQQEIADQFGYRSLGTVQDFIIRLQGNGYLEKSWNAKRGIKVSTPERALPLLGKVAAGLPVEVLFHQEQIEVPARMIRKSGEYYALQVKGDSMRDEGILDRDTIVVRKQSTAENGQKVVAIIDNGATIKTYYRSDGRVELKPANENFQTIQVDPSSSFRIEGIFAGLLRFNEEKE
jgi:repressor LexA